MRLFTNIFLGKMETRHFKGKLCLSAILFLVLMGFIVADARSHIPARVLAKQTGATQFEEEQYETHADCSEHKHSLRKRASDEDVDYEVYQGVVGRPGIDFPIYPRIPKTTFSCRSYGNGYFADMETDCQVFHICEDGRKISFLCPNGTIFQQSELTCDWWFKVNCLGSSGFYAESTELLSKHDHSLKPVVPVQGFNIVGGGLDIKPRVPAKSTSRDTDGANATGKGGRPGSGKGRGSDGGIGGGTAGKVSAPRVSSGGSNINGNGGGKGSGSSSSGKGKQGSGSSRTGTGASKDHVPNASNEHYSVGSSGPKGSNDHYKNGNDGPGASNENYKTGNSGPGATNKNYKTGSAGPGASNENYKSGSAGPGASNENYKTGSAGPGGSNENYKTGSAGPGGSNENYKSGSAGPGGSNEHYGSGFAGPGGSNERYNNGFAGPGGSNEHYKSGSSGPSNANYKVGSAGPGGSNDRYKTGNAGPSGEHYQVGSNGPSNENYKVGKNGPGGSNDRYKSGSSGPSGEHYKSGSDGPSGEHYKSGSSGPRGEHYKVGKNGPGGDDYKVGSNGPNGNDKYGNVNSNGNSKYGNSDGDHYQGGNSGATGDNYKVGGAGPRGDQYKVGVNGAGGSDKHGNNDAIGNNKYGNVGGTDVSSDDKFGKGNAASGSGKHSNTGSSDASGNNKYGSIGGTDANGSNKFGNGNGGSGSEQYGSIRGSDANGSNKFGSGNGASDSNKYGNSGGSDANTSNKFGSGNGSSGNNKHGNSDVSSSNKFGNFNGASSISGSDANGSNKFGSGNGDSSSNKYGSIDGSGANGKNKFGSVSGTSSSDKYASIGGSDASDSNNFGSGSGTSSSDKYGSIGGSEANGSNKFGSGSGTSSGNKYGNANGASSSTVYGSTGGSDASADNKFGSGSGTSSIHGSDTNAGNKFGSGGGASSSSNKYDNSNASGSSKYGNIGGSEARGSAKFGNIGSSDFSGSNEFTSVVSTSHSFDNSNGRPERRMDSDETPSLESVDFEDLSNEKPLKGSAKPELTAIDTNDNDESQITAESASFVSDHHKNLFNNNGKETANQGSGQGAKTAEGTRRGSGDRGSQRHGYTTLNGETLEKSRGTSSQRGNQRYREDKNGEVEEKTRNSSDDKSNKKYKYVGVVETTAPHTFAHGTGGAGKAQSSTPSYVSGTYTTARRLDSTRTTPFYTPTVPSVGKGKTGDGKSSSSHHREGSATTPAPHRFNVNNNNAGIFLEGESGLLKPTVSPSNSQDSESSIETTTLRSIIIGMRHNYDDSRYHSTEVLNGRANTNVEFPLPKNHKYFEDDESFEFTTPASTGPTYLPKSAASSKAGHGSNGDFLLSAPVTKPEGDEVSRNVNDMLKTMNVLQHKFEDVELVNGNGKTNGGNGNNRLGLDIPASSGPDALISLAKYFATEENESANGQGNFNANALVSGKAEKTEGGRGASGSGSSSGSAKGPSSSQSLTSASLSSSSGSSHSTHVLAPKDKPSDTTATLTTESSPSLAANSDNISSSLLSNNTVRKYNTLFGLESSADGSNSETQGRSGGSSAKSPHTQDIVTSFPQIGPTDETIRALAEKPESRKIAQVFSNALNDYLNDPVKFRDELISARPTEPPFDNKFTFVSVTDSTLFNHGTAATYLPTVAPPTNRPYSTTESSLAADINSHLITSTGYPDSDSTTNAFDGTTDKSSAELKQHLEFSAELEPPSSDSGEELLQREHTQSFVNNKNRNELLRNANKSDKLTTDAKPAKPWSFIQDDDVLDPLKINDGLMKRPYQSKGTSSSTSSGSLLTGEVSGKVTGHLDILGDSQYRSTASRIEAEGQHNEKYSTDAAADPWADIFESYDLSKESLPTTTGLQRIANKLFGGLNENEALHLKNVMAEAEHNRQILRLLLLLIQTCDDNNGKALERSRKSLLNALISMDGKLKSGQEGKSSHVKQNTLTTTEKLPVTTYRRTGSGEEITTSTISSYGSTTTDVPTTTLIGSTTTSDGGANSSEATTKFAIIVDEIENEGAATTETGTISGSSAPGSLDGNADKRALELLKSLYSLASKFTSRR